MQPSFLARLTALAYHRYLWETAPLRGLPDFFIIGGMKCGTTSFYDLLVQHPQILPGACKEVHFFDLQFQNGLRWYRAHFPFRANSRFKKLVTGRKTFTCEASPYYIFHPHAARRLAGLFPRAKLIAMLRDPVDRAYSHYRHSCLIKKETLPFAEAIEREGERLRGEREKLLADESYQSMSYHWHAYVSHGIYVDRLAEFHKYFPRDQILVIRSEDYFGNPGEVYERALRFLGVDPALARGVKLPGTPPRHQLEPAVESRLRDLFAPHNQRLYEYLGVDFGW